VDFIWWEKTVEYLFVQKYVDVKTVIAPLGGLQEKGGDAIFSGDEKFILIEFKRDAKSIESEVEKFDGGATYKKAQAELCFEDSHHLLIYGKMEGNELQLKCRTYFSGIPTEANSALSNGKDEEPFMEYLYKFINFKVSKQGSSGGGYSCVAGVNSAGKITKVLNSSEFERALELKFALNTSLKVKKERAHTSSNDFKIKGP
jgi:hypothetical protein